MGEQIQINIETGDLVSVSRAAEMLSRPRITIYRWVNTGKILSIKLGGTIFIPWTEVERLYNERGNAKGEANSLNGPTTETNS